MLTGSTCTRLVQNLHRLSNTIAPFELPVFLCPALLRHGHQPGWGPSTSINFNRSQTRRHVHTSVQHTHSLYDNNNNHNTDRCLLRLPQQCPGCGAHSQAHDDQEPGFYSLERRSVKTYVDKTIDLGQRRRSPDDQVLQAALANVKANHASIGSPLVPSGTQLPLHISSGMLSSVGEIIVANDTPVRDETPPMCDRCHRLLHHHTGISIHHPSIDAIKRTLAESPHKYNHVYHVLDAADFPMSLIPNLQRVLNLTRLRSQNRRSKTGRYYQDRKFEISFIITRSDLLAPLKNQIDSLMPYLTSVLRDALGFLGKNVRLGNVRCVSAKRGWWTKELKEDIWQRGGGGWMVGKVNVGKSQLFHSVFTKVRRGTVKLDHPLETDVSNQGPDPDTVEDAHFNLEEQGREMEYQWKRDETDMAMQSTADFSLLPPLQPETDYPVMPLVSPLPGTTASPIRVPFGNGKGELVYLPGLSRGDLELYVQARHRALLVMKSRIVPVQQVIKPGQSLLLGGFIRITPVNSDVIIMAYSFTPIHSHLTSTEKAIEIQMQERESGVENIGIPGIREKTKSAGQFPLKWDVTKQRSGPVTASDAVGIKVERLPYKVLSTDILIEGCGWVELVAQVRKKALGLVDTSVRPVITNQKPEIQTDPTGFHWPEVEVFSPEGKFIAARKPMGAWLLGQKKVPTGIKSRPRRSMKGAKKKLKSNSREIG